MSLGPHPPDLVIAQADGPLPACTPYLMPFHIDYSGPAPISTFFRVKPAPPPSYLQNDAQKGRQDCGESTLAAGESQASSSSQATLVSGSSSSLLAESQVTLVDNAARQGDNRTGATDQRLVAAFRGRTVQGLRVAVPEGYVGVVLQTPDGTKSAQADNTAPKQKTMRTTRRSSHPGPMMDVDMDMDVGDGASHADGTAMSDETARALQPVSTFSSFVLWNQDIPVDEGKDEYLRSLREWTRLATEIHRVEEV